MIPAALALFGNVCTAHAASFDYLDLAPEDLLKAEVVSVSKRPEKISDTASAVYVITRDDIWRSGATTIPDALRLAPGVQVAQLDGNSFAISIRGFNSALSNKLLVMMDGRTLYNPLFAGTYWEAQDVVLADIERIEVIRGPGGSLWGANAVNGVINIITRHTSETQGNVADVIVGTHEQAGASVRHGGSFGGEGDNSTGTYRVYAKTFDRDRTQAVTGGEAYDDWYGRKAGFRADWSDEFTLQGDVYHTRTHQRTRLVLPAADTISESLTYQGANILGRMKKANDSGGVFTLQSYLDYTRRDDPAILEDTRIIFDTEAQYDFASRGAHEWIVGGNYRLTSDNEENSLNAALLPDNRRDNLFGVFFQDKITLSPDKLFLTLGTKFEHNEYSGFEYQPNARLAYLLDENQTVWGAVSRAVRTPSRYEHDVLIPATPAIDIIGNRNLDSEELLAYELGYRNQISPALSVDVATFYNVYDDLAAFEFTGPDAHYTNSMDGHAAGGELSANWNVTDRWSLSGTYSYINISVDSDTLDFANADVVEGSTPHHQATLRSSLNVVQGVTFDTSAYSVSHLDNGDISPYVRVDAHVGWQVTEGLNLSLTGQNLFQDSHQEFPNGINAAEVERSVYGKLTWEF